MNWSSLAARGRSLGGSSDGLLTWGAAGLSAAATLIHMDVPSLHAGREVHGPM